MKKLNKITAILMALAMILTLGVTAFAAEGGETSSKNDSITINNAKPGETYEIYKLFDLVVDDEADPTAYSYTVNEDWAAFFAAAGETTPAGPGAQYITVNPAGYVTAISDAAALAKAAATWSGKPDRPVDSVTVAEGETTAVFSNLEDGYWLITSTLGTFAMTETTPDASEVTINEKNAENTIEKEVKEDTANEYTTNNDAQIGDLIEFQSTVKIVKGTRNVVVHDKMDAGLTYTAGSIAISGLNKGTEYTVNESPADGDTFDIAFDQTWIDTLDFGDGVYKEYVITYTATLNANALSNTDGIAIVEQVNKTHISFGDATESAEDTTTTTTHKFAVFKHAANSTTNLAGAVFSLKKDGALVPLIKIDDTNYRVAMPNETGAVNTFTTVASGDIVIWGVDTDDDYTLEEITPPAGYNKLTAEVPVTVDSNNQTRIMVENNTGTELPSTGGIGTKIFTIVGAILIVGAGLTLIVRRRMNRE